MHWCPNCQTQRMHKENYTLICFLFLRDMIQFRPREKHFSNLFIFISFFKLFQYSGQVYLEGTILIKGFTKEKRKLHLEAVVLPKVSVRSFRALNNTWNTSASETGTFSGPVFIQSSLLKWNLAIIKRISQIKNALKFKRALEIWWGPSLKTSCWVIL